MSAQPASSRTSGCWRVIREIHKANFEAYGYRRTWKALRRAGEHVPRCQVQRLMRQAGIQGAKRRGKPWRTTIPDPDAIRPADLVERDFTASRPDELWVCDFTRLRCWDGVLYFAFVIDVFSRRVVGWQLATHMRDTLVIDALRMALTQRRPGADVALVVHSDAGSQYTSYDHTQVLDDHDVLQSIGPSATRSITRSPRASWTASRPSSSAIAPGRTRTGLEFAIVEYLGWFNHDRLHSSLGDIPPAEFEALARTTLLQRSPLINIII